MMYNTEKQLIFIQWNIYQMNSTIFHQYEKG
jgi:hypothetical protein